MTATTSYERGYEYGQQVASEQGVQLVDFSRPLPAIPDADDGALRRLGVTPDARRYWQGVNVALREAGIVVSA